MKKIYGYIKTYFITLLFCFIILFVEAICELNIPNLMSDLVNVGIQSHGIENSAPEAMSENAYILMKNFMVHEEKLKISENYIFIASGGLYSEYNYYLKKYPLLATENIYVLKKDHPTSKNILSSYFNNASMTMILSLKQVAEQNADAKNLSKDISEINLDNLYKLIPILESVSDARIISLRNETEDMDDYIKSQASIMITNQIYKELGINIYSIQSRYIMIVGLKMILMTILVAACAVTVALFSSRIASGVSRNLRKDIFKKIEYFSNVEFDKFSTASLITRTTNDITQIQTVLVFAIRLVCYAPIMAVGGMLMAASKNVSMSWVIALGSIFLIGLIVTIFSIATPKFKIVQSLIDKLNLIIRENLSGLMVIRAFGNQKYEEERFENANSELTKVNLFVNRIMIIMMPAMMLIMNCVGLLIIWNGAHEIEASKMQVGDMMAFMQYAMQVIMAFIMISIMFILIPRGLVSAERVSEVLNTCPSIKDKINPTALSYNHSGKLEFRNVSFKYLNADEYVLKDINFIAKKGETTAFIGATGSGKSTLINLIPRFYEATKGRILLDGIDIKDITQHELRNNIGYVPQKGVLFSGTIESNLKYADKEATDSEIKLAAEISQSVDFIKETEYGFKNPISQGGGNVSGGQKQRLSIARALIKKARIYIFDDSFSALDFKTDSLLRKALKKYTKDATVIIIAQRISTIMNAEQIVVIDKGKIVGKGTHKYLLDNCKEYLEIAKSQLSKEELL